MERLKASAVRPQMETQVDNEETSRTHKKPKTGFPVPERREG